MQSKFYSDLTKGQKTLVYLISVALILCYGIGVIPLAFLIFFELGARKV